MFYDFVAASAAKTLDFSGWGRLPVWIAMGKWFGEDLGALFWNFQAVIKSAASAASTTAWERPDDGGQWDDGHGRTTERFGRRPQGAPQAVGEAALAAFFACFGAKPSSRDQLGILDASAAFPIAWGAPGRRLRLAGDGLGALPKQSGWLL